MSGEPRFTDKPIRLAFSALLVVVVLYRLTTTVADCDLWGYLAFGRLFWETGKFPYNDVFTFVPTLKPWVYHEWLTGVLFYPIYQTLGAPGLQVLKYLLGSATLAFVYLTARRRGAAPLTAGLGILLIVGLLRLGYSPVRAQVFTYFCFALTFYVLESARLSGHCRRLWLLVPVQILWCNLHGGFLAGLGLMAIYAVGQTISRQQARFYWVILVLAAAATLINPYGWHYWDYLFKAIAMPRPEISEWASVYHLAQFGSAPGAVIYFLLVAAMGFIWIVRFREVIGGLALVFTGYLGIQHQRHQVFCLILLGAYLPDLLALYLADLLSRPAFRSLGQRLGRRIPAAVALVITFLLALGILRQAPLNLKIPALPEVDTETATYYPLGAIAYLRQQHFSGKIATHFDWGEYLLWTLYPQYKVALDGRFETVYPPEVCQDYFDFILGRPDWRKFLDRYSPDIILIDCRTTLFAVLTKQTDWKQVYLDAGSALFFRKP